MKIVTEKSVYIQKKDILILRRIPMPRSMFFKIYGNDIVIVNDSNKYEFMEFNEPEIIIFLSNLDCIINYNEFKDLSVEEIIKIGEDVIDEKNRIAEEYNALSVELKQEKIYMIEEWELLEHKKSSIRDILWFKKGELQFELPEGVEYPEGIRICKENGVKRLIKNIFKFNKRTTSI